MNKYILYDNYAELVLFDKNKKEKGRALIDIDDLELVSNYKWYLGKNNYVSSKCKASDNKLIYLHRLILNPDKGFVVDHINNYTLDNRKCNLRICTQHQNTINKKPSSSDTGVFIRAGRWEARIMYNYKNIYLGRFDTKDEAIMVRRQAEEKYFGEFKYQGGND